MTGIRELTCIVCPLGCRLEVCIDDGKVQSVAGNGCKKGINYAQAECTNPVRTLTTTIRVDGGISPLISVKSQKSIPKDMLLDCMKCISNTVVHAPVRINDVVISNILNTGINIVATKNIRAVK